MNYAIMVDFGSTYTKLVCVDLNKRQTVVSDKFPSTVHTDANINFDQCMDAAAKVIGEDSARNAVKFASSSAAGGLRIAVSGLTKGLSHAAGRNACFSAGGKLVHGAAGSLKESDIKAIEEANAEIVLLCGGYEKGNYEGVLQNAEILSQSSLKIPVIYAGNSEIVKRVRLMFAARGKECFVAENIIPEIGVLNIKPTTDIIRNLFMSRITNMKGVGVVAQKLDGPIIPTPAAVLKAGELLSRGTSVENGAGPMMMVDLGGATTDIYSYMENIAFNGAKCIGVEEPYAKRTVEGDLGMRESSACLMREMGDEAFAGECGISVERALEAVESRNTDRAYIADNDLERRIDEVIAANAIGISARRHAGTVEKGYMNGLSLIQRGKNLTEIKRVIGTGGIIVNSDDPETKLRNLVIKPKERDRVLLPENVEFMVDRQYVLYAAGLLADKYEDTALAIMKDSIGIDR